MRSASRSRNWPAPENALNIVFRVSPRGPSDDPVYFTQHMHVPPIEDDAKGDAYLQGLSTSARAPIMSTGSCGTARERVCSFYWDTDADLPPRTGP